MNDLTSEFILLVDGQAEAHAELGIIFEEAVGPRRTAAVLVLGPGRRGQVGAINRGTAGGVGNDRTVAEQLADQLDVRRLAAARACAGELEEGLEQL